MFMLSALVPLASRAQLLVEAPVLETIASNQTGIMATMNMTLSAIEQAERKVEAIKEVAGWIDQLESMQEFIRLLETTACLAKDLDVSLRIALGLLGPGAYCLSDFEYRLNINRLRYVVDAINLVLTEGFSMSRSGRMSAYHDALTTFHKAQIGLGQLALFLRRVIHRYQRAQRYKESLLGINNINQYKTHRDAIRF